MMQPVTFSDAGLVTAPDSVDLESGTKYDDPVSHPAHYTSSPAQCSQCGHPVECIDVVQHMTFSQGNAIKYLWRLFGKGDPVENLRKAIQYCEFEIARLEATPSEP